MKAKLSVKYHFMFIQKSDQTFVNDSFKNFSKAGKHGNGTIVGRVIAFTFFKYWSYFSCGSIFGENIIGKAAVNENLDVGS